MAHVDKIVSSKNSIFHPIPQQNDVGIDGIIEFIINGETTGCCVAIQVKAGSHYTKNGNFKIPCNIAHIRYWSSHILPVAGIVVDPTTDEARWIDITAHFEHVSHAKSCTILAKEAFSRESFNDFVAHFIAYIPKYSDARHFASALRSFSKTEELPECISGIRSLFSFHRNKFETWFYILAALRFFRGHTLLRYIVVSLAHIPGHGDIFWHEKNIVSEVTRKSVLDFFSKSLSRDDILTLIGAIDSETGIDRGTIGQCVDSIIRTIPARLPILESIAHDLSVDSMARFWATLLYIEYRQGASPEECITLLEKVIPSAEQDDQERFKGIREMLLNGELMHFY